MSRLAAGESVAGEPGAGGPSAGPVVGAAVQAGSASGGPPAGPVVGAAVEVGSASVGPSADPVVGAAAEAGSASGGLAAGLAMEVESAAAGSVAEPGPAAAGRTAARVLRALLRRPLLLLSGVFLVLLLVAAFHPAALVGGDPLLAVPVQRLSPPSLHHLFGTDELGRDLFTRVVYGAALSARASVIAVGVGLVTGGLIGLLAGYRGGWVDAALMRVVDVLLAIPSLLLALALVTALGFGTVHVAFAVGLTSVAGFARLARAETLRVRGSVYVEAAHAAGARWHTVLARHIVPNAFGPVLALATLELGTVVLAVSALSFLGFGASPPTPEWGALVAEGRDYLATAWWISTLPGVTIAVTVLAVGRVARALEGR